MIGPLGVVVPVLWLLVGVVAGWSVMVAAAEVLRRSRP